MRKVTVGSLLFVALVAASPASAQGTVRGAQEGAEAGGRAAGPAGAVVGGAVGAATGTIGGILGVQDRPRFRDYVVRENDLHIDISKTCELERYYQRAASPTMMYLLIIMSLAAIVTPS